MTLRTIREYLTLALVALLPFHAFLVTTGTRILQGPYQAPMTELALWKEALLLLILLWAAFEWLAKPRLKLDVLDFLILGLIALGIAVTFFTHQNWSLFAYGFRYDFVPLIAFLVLRRVEWSPAFRVRLLNTLVAVGVVIAVYALTTSMLPAAFFTFLGYSDLHSIYLPNGPIAAFQYIGETGLRRLQGTFSGPNQFGLWMVLPYAIALIFAFKKKGKWRFAVAALLLLAILSSFSRAAWIVTALVTVLAMGRDLPRKHLMRVMTWGIPAVAFLFIALLGMYPEVILRVTSSRDHIARPLEALQLMVIHPLGRGIGMAGPASNRVSDPCIDVAVGSDTSWANDRPELCLFADGKQVKPLDRPCNCPMLPENWYLQIGVEMGWIGFFMFIALTLIVLRRLNKKRDIFSDVVFLAFMALSIAALVLHAWEDGAAAYTLWMLVAAALPQKGK